MTTVSRTGPRPSPKMPAPPITLTQANVGKASDIAREQVQAAIALVQENVSQCRTPLEVTLTPNFARTRGLPGPEPVFKKGVQVVGNLSDVSMNSVMQVKVRTNDVQAKAPITFTIQLASDNLPKPGVRLFNAQQIADLIAGFSAHAGKNFSP